METIKKYKLTNETIKIDGITLYRIRAIKSFSNVNEGDLGGWIEKEDNLSQIGNAWVCDNARVFGNAEVHDNAKIFGDAKVEGDAIVHGNAVIRGDAIICGKTDYIIFEIFCSNERYFTWTRSNNMWSVGCFYGTGKELIEKVYRDSERLDREYERVVRYVNRILADDNNSQIVI